jgi:hypothetical protein
MTTNSWPFVSQPTTDLQYSKLFRALQRTGVVGVVNDTQLKGSASSAGMTTSVALGAAFIRGFWFEVVETPETMVHANSTSLPRIDRTVLRLDFNQTLVDRVQLAIVQGAHASNPSLPSLTQDVDGIWEMPLYRTTIGSGISSIASSAVLDERPFIGHQVDQWTTDTRPNPPTKYDVGFNETLARWEFWNGTTWAKLWQGISWADISDRPVSSTLDGRDIFVQATAPVGKNGDIWFEA